MTGAERRRHSQGDRLLGGAASIEDESAASDIALQYAESPGPDHAATEHPTDSEVGTRDEPHSRGGRSTFKIQVPAVAATAAAAAASVAYA